MNVVKLIYTLKQKGVLTTPKEVYAGLNKVRFHGRLVETTKHFIVKAILGKIIRSKNEDFISEYSIPDRTFDVLHIKKNGLISYEPESDPKKFYSKINVKGVDSVLIDLNKVPNNIEEMEKYLKQILI